MPHLLHYISADGPGPDATWSVYCEQYPDLDTDVPIEGTQEHVSQQPNETSAQAEAEFLQARYVKIRDMVLEPIMELRKNWQHEATYGTWDRAKESKARLFQLDRALGIKQKDPASPTS